MREAELRSTTVMDVYDITPTALGCQICAVFLVDFVCSLRT